MDGPHNRFPYSTLGKRVEDPIIRYGMMSVETGQLRIRSVFCRIAHVSLDLLIEPKFGPN